MKHFEVITEQERAIRAALYAQPCKCATCRKPVEPTVDTPAPHGDFKCSQCGKTEAVPKGRM